MNYNLSEKELGGYDKELIRRRFEKAGDTYERYAGMQEYSARRLADIVSASCPDFEDMKVLEIGAGTGSLTRMLTGGGSMVFSHGYYANDIVDTMAPLYRSMGLTPLMGDISSVDIPYDLDAVVSSNCLQWVSDMPSLLSGLYSALKPGGRLCFSTFGFRHFIQLRTVGMAALDYFTLEDMNEMLSDTGFTVEKAEQETDEMLFPSASDMLRYFSLTGVNAVRSPGGMWTPARLAHFEAGYRREFPASGGELPLTVHYMWFSCSKPRKAR